MILFFTAAPHSHTLDGLRGSPHGRPRMQVRSYDWLFARSRLRAAACVFTDFDRLRHFELLAAARAFRQLREAGLRVLNDPARSAQRAELLFLLHKTGVNRFRGYPAAHDPAPARFPVFLKCVSDHRQDFDELIPDQDALERRLRSVRASGYPLRDLLVIEFANREHRAGIYRRHTVYRIGDRMIPSNPVTEAGPFAKYGVDQVATDADRALSVDEIYANPYGERMRPVFELASIEYGRLDFGFDGDEPAVYEINTNPFIGTHVPGAKGRFAEAVAHSMRLVVEAVDALDGEDRTVRLTHPPGTLYRRPRFGPRRLRQP